MLRVAFNGPALADKIASLLNKRMRGRIEIGSIEWPVSALKTVVTGGWIPVEIHDVKVWDDCALSDGEAADPEAIRTTDPDEDCTPDDRPDPDPRSHRKPRKLLVAAPYLTAELDAHALLFGKHDFVFRHVWVHGGEALLEQTNEPYPLHAYNRTILSIVTAFYPRMKAGFRAGIYADAPPPVFDLRDIHLAHLNVTVHVSPYPAGHGRVGYDLTARIEDVNADATPSDERTAHSYLYVDPTDPLVAKLYVRLALHGAHGWLRIRDVGPRGAFHIPGGHAPAGAWAAGRTADYQLALSDIALDRLAQLPIDWSRRDDVARSLELDLTAHTVTCNGAPGGGATLHLAGEIDGYWDRPYDGRWNLALDAANLGPTMRSCIKPTLGGDHLGGRIALTGPFVVPPKITLDLHGLDIDVPILAKQDPLRLTLAQVSGDIDLVNDQGSIDQTTALIQGGKEPGEVMLSASFGVRPTNARASIDITKPIDIGRFLPKSLAASAGRYLAGKLTASGDVDQGFALSDFDLSLGTTPGDKAIRVHHGRIFTENDFDTVQIQKVAVEARRSHAVFDGWVDTQKLLAHVRIDGVFPDLDAWLARFGLPQFAKSAGGGTITIDGPLRSPTIGVRVNLAGVPCLDTLRLDAQIAHGLARIEHVSSASLGGQLDGTGTIVLGQIPLVQRFHLDGRHLDAAKVCGLGGTLHGTIDTLGLDLRQTPLVKDRSLWDWLPYFQVYLQAAHLRVLGDAYSNVAACIDHPDDDKLCRPRKQSVDRDDLGACDEAKKQTGGFCAVATAQRDRGGRLDATIASLAARRSASAPGGTRRLIPAHLAGAVALDNVPMAILDQWIGKGRVGGLFSALLHVSGTREAPQASGAIDVLRGWFADGFIGDSQLEVAPIQIGKRPGVLLQGTALAGQLSISAAIGTEAPYPVDLAISGRRVEVDQFVNLAAKLGLPEPVQAWASGTISLHTELAPLDHKPAKPEAWIELTELEGIVDHRTNDGRRMPLRFAVVPGSDGRYAMSLHVTPATIELACRNPSKPGGREPCPAELDTPAGRVAIEGSASATGMHLHALGSLDLARLQTLLENQVDQISGVLGLEGDITGTFDHPAYAVSLSVEHTVSVRPVGGDSELQILGPHQGDDPKAPLEPGALIKLANGSVGFNSFTIKVKDPRKTEQGELHVTGAVGLDGLRPASWGLLIDGKIAGKMLLAVLPDKVSQASGLARIDGSLVLSGKGRMPHVEGTISFDPAPEDRTPAPLTFVPRGLRREVALLGGSFDIHTTADRSYVLQVDPDDHPITASIDGEGRLENISGTVVVRDGLPTQASIRLDANNVPFHTTDNDLDLTLAARDIALDLDGGIWHARGDIAIVSGDYKHNFEITDVIKPTPAVVAPAKPFWDEYPSIGNAELSLALEVRRFTVADNVAQIELSGPRILITGTPRDPRLSGSIRVQRGTFKIPGTRAQFTETSGSIDFAENDQASNPSLNVSSYAPDYIDLSGQTHRINLSITGTLQQPQWDLSTSTGYNKSQTLALLFLGRNPEQLRRTLGDQSLGTDPMRVDPTTNPSSGFADQIVKDLAGDWVTGLIGQSLTNLTHIDVLRFEIGFGSVGIHVEKKIFENVRATGEAEQTIRGYTVDVHGEVQLPYHLLHVITGDRFSGQIGYLQKTFSDPADQAQNLSDVQLKAVYRLFIP